MQSINQQGSPTTDRPRRRSLPVKRGNQQPSTPSAIGRFLEGFEAAIAHLRAPIAHCRAVRTANLLERRFGEERRRTKGIPPAFGGRARCRI